MENELNVLVVEQQKTNQLLGQLLADNQKKARGERRHFWIGLIWHSIPLLLTLFFIWQMYTFVNHQVTDIQTKVNNTFDVGQIKDKIGTLFK